MRGGSGSRGGSFGGFRGSSLSRISTGSRRAIRGSHRSPIKNQKNKEYDAEVIVTVFFLIGLIPIFVISSSLGAGFAISDDLQPGEMMIIDGNEYVSISNDAETTKTYFFDTRPQISGFLNYNENQSSLIDTHTFVYWEDIYSRNSSILITWTLDTSINFYLILGKSSFNQWKNGEPTEYYTSSISKGLYLYTAKTDGAIYFVFENTADDIGNIDVSFNIQVPVFDTSSAKKFIGGSFSGKKYDSKYIVIENTGDHFVNFNLNLRKRFSSTIIFFFLQTTFLAFLVGIAGYTMRRNKKKLKQQKSIESQNKGSFNTKGRKRKSSTK